MTAAEKAEFERVKNELATLKAKMSGESYFGQAAPLIINGEAIPSDKLTFYLKGKAKCAPVSMTPEDWVRFDSEPERAKRAVLVEAFPKSPTFPNEDQRKLLKTARAESQKKARAEWKAKQAS